MLNINEIDFLVDTIGVNFCTKDDLELVKHRKKQVKIIGQVKDILDGELSEEV